MQEVFSIEQAAYHRHDISDKVWALLEPHLPGQKGRWGGIAEDNRRFINAVFWVLRTRALYGVICPATMVNGEQCISAFAAGEIREYWKSCWKYSLMIQIMNGS